jgi:hypothetical protein
MVKEYDVMVPMDTSGEWRRGVDGYSTRLIVNTPHILLQS